MGWGSGRLSYMADDEARSLMPQMRLDELLSELQVRLEAVLATRDRVHALLDAVSIVSAPSASFQAVTSESC